MSVAGPENQLDCDKPESRAEDHPGHGHWATLVLLADCVDDLEKVRIANENRYRSLTSQEDWGKGVLPGPDEVVMIEASIDGLKLMEKTAVKTLEKGMAAHPLGPWVKSQLGLGMKTVGRYLALVGDPCWHPVHDRERRLGELWAYCKFHVINEPMTGTEDQQEVGESRMKPEDQARDDNSIEQTESQGIPESRPSVEDHSQDDSHDTPVTQVGSGEGGGSKVHTENHGLIGFAPRRRKGVKVNWSTQARMRAHLMAECCVKQMRSPFRKVYDKRRAHTQNTHPDWTDGHSHNDAMRITGKAIVKALWIESRRLRGLSIEAPVHDREASVSASPGSWRKTRTEATLRVVK